MKKTKILVIEDERDIREGIGYLLEESYEVQLAEGGLEGIKSAMRSPPDLILLDLNMPDLHGFQVCKAFRSDREFDNTPIIILTAYNDSADRTKSFELGADDYIPKPFNNLELLARIKRKLETRDVPNKGTSSEFISCGNLKVNLRNFEVTIDNKAISLSALEFKLLHFFLSNKERLLSRREIIENVWENQDVSERIIDPHVLSLRSKLLNFNHTITSVYRGGYILKSFEKV